LDSMWGALMFRTVLVGLGVLWLAACGGGQDNASTASPRGSSAPVPAPSTVLKSTTRIVSQSDPVVSLEGIASIDFTGARDLNGAIVTLAQAESGEISQISTELAPALDASFSSETVIRISLNRAPTSPLPIRIFDAPLVQGVEPNQFPAIFAIQLADSDGAVDVDGGPVMQALPSTSSTQDNSISATIPTSDFQLEQDQYVAYLKIGASTISSSLIRTGESSGRAAGQREAGQQIDAEQISLPCPFGPSTPGPPIPDSQPGIVVPRACVERSRFNRVRYLPTQRSRPHSHVGMDLAANIGTAAFVPEGGRPMANLTRARSVPGTGITLALDYGGYRVRLLHLSRISEDLIDAAGNVRPAAVTSRQTAVAFTGDTAIPGQPHLHYEVLVPDSELCKVRQSGRVCGPTWTNIDPFPLMVSRILISERSNTWYLQRGASFRFILQAIDSAGAEVASEVNSAFENGGVAPPSSAVRIPYDPTRKVCISASQTSVQLPAADNSSSFRGIGGYICRPWGRSLDILGLSSLPPAELAFRFSFDAARSIISDPLSAAFESFELRREMSHCLSLDLIWIGDVCTILGGVATQNAADVSRVTMRSDNPAIATTRVSLSPTRGPPYLIQLSVIAGSTAGETNVHYYIDGRFQKTFSVSNQARRD
jgi:murein DD-endopeptidase MepM/ murein hydrolase activator NlpD